MLGIAYNSTLVATMLIDRAKYHPCTIERQASKRVIKKDGVIVKTVDEYKPAEVFESFLKENSGGRQKVAFVNGYETLFYLKSEDSVRYIIFDAAQVLSKNGIEIIDAELPIGNNGVWRTYENFPKIFKSKIPKMKLGFTYSRSAPNFRVSVILEEAASQLNKAGAFKRLVAKYIFGLVTTDSWAQKTSRLSTFLEPTVYNKLMAWMNTFAPDALSLVFMDILYYAPGRCEKYVSEGSGEKSFKETKKKFMAVVDKSCKDCNADIEDMKYLLEILPPDIDLRGKFLFPIPPHLATFRKAYPLINRRTNKLLPNV